jgi:hypothetical protein
MYSMDEILRLQGGDPMRRMQRTRAQTGIRPLPRTTDVDSFLSACGLKGKRK